MTTPRATAAALALAAGLASPSPGAAAVAVEDFAGLWRGAVIYEQAKKEIEVVVELAPAADGALAGTIDIPSFRLEYKPLEEVRVDGRKVSFLFRHDSETRGAAAPFVFEGELGADGATIAGGFTEHVGTVPFRLERIGDAFSERPSRETPPVVPMAPAGDQLREAFNRDEGDVRLLLLLSPRCGICLSSARMVQRYVFDRLDSPRLAGYVVWGPMLGDETEAHAETATGFLNDARVTHFWTPEHVLAGALSGPVGLPADEPAWDTFLLYAPGTRWGETPPAPAVVMHVDRSLPAEQRLDAEALHARAAELLGRIERGRNENDGGESAHPEPGGGS